MSVFTWKKEFYDVKPSADMTRKQSIAHSLKKWKGLTKENLKKHGLTIKADTPAIYDTEGKAFDIDCDSCALCLKYGDSSGDFVLGLIDSCDACPLFKVLHNNQCDDGDESPYIKWLDSGNALPMIKALTKLTKLKEKGKKVKA
jgi:hypothetical protein